jgi:short-subunit dehydrogenase
MLANWNIYIRNYLTCFKRRHTITITTTQTKMQQTVLIVGATGNIGASAIHAALRSKLHVLAIVRNQTSAEKLFRNVGTREGITTAEADITSDRGVKDVVDKVRKGELPAFQHVYAAGESVLCASSEW